MYEDSIILYEVSAYTDAKNPQQPCYMDKFERKADALRDARRIKGLYPRVEFTIEVDEHDPNNLLGEGKLIAVWENGKKTA